MPAAAAAADCNYHGKLSHSRIITYAVVPIPVYAYTEANHKYFSIWFFNVQNPRNVHTQFDEMRARLCNAPPAHAHFFPCDLRIPTNE